MCAYIFVYVRVLTCAYWHARIRKIRLYDTCMRSSLISELHCTCPGQTDGILYKPGCYSFQFHTCNALKMVFTFSATLPNNLFCITCNLELTLQTTNLFLTLSISLVSRSHSLIFLPADSSVFPFGPSLMHDTPCLSAFHLLRRIKLKSECIYNNTIHNIR